MKKFFYRVLIPFVVILGIPFMVFDKESWNAFGRTFDDFFGVKSRHTKLFEVNYEEKDGE